MPSRAPQIPVEEAIRLQTLESLRILDTPPEEEFDRITQLASDLLRMPIAAISFVDRDRQWFKSSVGLEIRQTARADAFCNQTILQQEPLIVEDALADERFRTNPLVLGYPNIRFYAGAPLYASNGAALGTLCVIDGRPRRWSARRARILCRLADIAAEAIQHRQTARQAHAATIAKSAFLASMSHEIRTPMNAVLGNAELLRSRDLAGPEREMAIDAIERNGRHLMELINNLLDLSRIEAGKLELHHAPLRPAQLVQDVRAMFESLAAAKGVSIRADWQGPADLVLRSDELRIRQMLINLVSNAVKFTKAGQISIAASAQPASVNNPDKLRVEFRVRDNGPGLTPEQARSLFQPFVQVGDIPTDRRSSTGLGLAISRELARMLGGDMDVRSEPGAGSEFRFWLLADQASNTPQASDQSRNPTLLQGIHVLVVDDGIDNQRLLATFLRKAGAQVSLASDGCQAARAAAEQAPPFDLILMDVQMPNMDGLEATRTMRAAGCSTPIIALTAFASPEDQTRCLAAGCDHYLTKPIDRATLVSAVRQAITPKPQAA